MALFSLDWRIDVCYSNIWTDLLYNELLVVRDEALIMLKNGSPVAGINVGSASFCKPRGVSEKIQKSFGLKIPTFLHLKHWTPPHTQTYTRYTCSSCVCWCVCAPVWVCVRMCFWMPVCVCVCCPCPLSPTQEWGLFLGAMMVCSFGPAGVGVAVFICILTYASARIAAYSARMSLRVCRLSQCTVTRSCLTHCPATSDSVNWKIPKILWVFKSQTVKLC